jgi:hypothetical protein
MLTLTPDELREITGYVQPAAQLRALHDQGFTRARRDRLGRVVLERAHYDAVAAQRASSPEQTPALRIPRLHLA